MAKRVVRKTAPDPDDYVEQEDVAVEERDEEEEPEVPRRRARPKRAGKGDMAIFEEDTEAAYRDEDAEDDEEEEEESPRRRLRAVRDEDEDEDEDQDDEVEEDDEEEDQPRSKRPPLKGGWGRFQRLRQESSNFPDEIKPTADEQVFRFLDDEPFVTYKLHWFNEIRQGQRAFICLEEDCPACDTTGDRPQIQGLFNVVLFDEDGDGAIKVLIAGSRLGQALEAEATGKDGPLTKNYWSIRKTGKGNQTSYIVKPIKKRDLKEDRGIPPLTAEELKQFTKQKYGPEYYEQKRTSRKDLREIVRTLAGED